MPRPDVQRLERLEPKAASGTAAASSPAADRGPDPKKSPRSPRGSQSWAADLRAVITVEDGDDYGSDLIDAIVLAFVVPIALSSSANAEPG